MRHDFDREVMSHICFEMVVFVSTKVIAIAMWLGEKLAVCFENKARLPGGEIMETSDVI